MQAYRIVDWYEQFEVADGRPAGMTTDRKKVKVKKLMFVREDCRLAHAKEPIFCKMQEKGNIIGMAIGLACHGFYRKLCAIAADQDRPYRGWILNARRRPMTLQDLEYLLDEREPQVLRWCMDILCSEGIELVEKVDFAPESAQASVNKREQAGKCGTRGLFINETETETKPNLTETKEGSDAAPIVSGSRDDAVTQVCQFLRINPDNKSDITTLRDIFDQIEVGVEQEELNVSVYERVVIEAKDAASYQLYKWGRFVNAMKRPPFNYVPIRREVPGGRFTERGK